MMSRGLIPQASGELHEVVATPPLDTAQTTSRGMAHRLALAADLAILGVAAFAVRWLGLTRQSLWLDEAYSVYLSAHRLPEIIGFTSGSDAHPPFYYIALHTWMVLFGSSMGAVRALSLVASVAALLMTYLVARVIASRRVALFASIMMTASAFQIWYAQEARMYALVTLATLIGFYGLAKAEQKGGLWAWVTYSVGILFALYLDYSAVYVMVGVVAWFIFVGRRKQGVILPFVLSTLGIAVGYLPWVPSFFEQMRSVNGLIAWIDGSSGIGAINVLTDFFFNLSNLNEPSTTTLGIVAAGLSLAVTAFALWTPRYHAAYPLLAFWVCAPLGLGLLSEFYNHPITIARTLMVVEPELFLLIALAIEELVVHWDSVAARVELALTSLLLIALLAGNVGAVARANTSIVKENWSGAASYVASRQQSGDLILFNAFFTQMPFDYYYHQREQSTEQVVVERGYQLQESLLYANLAQGGAGLTANSELQRYGRVWLIVSHAPSVKAAIPTELSSNYELIAQQQFVGITVLLYQTTA